MVINAWEQLEVFQCVPIIISRYMVIKNIKPIMERTTELKSIRIHDFKYSPVILLIENSEKEFPINQTLGHASIHTAYDTYGHIYPSKQEGMSEKLNDL